MRAMLVKAFYPWEQLIMMSQQLVLVLLNKEIVTILVYQVDAILMWVSGGFNFNNPLWLLSTQF